MLLDGQREDEAISTERQTAFTEFGALLISSGVRFDLFMSFRNTVFEICNVFTGLLGQI